MNKSTRNIIIIIIGLAVAILGYRYIYKGVLLNRETDNVTVKGVNNDTKVEELLNDIVKSIEDDNLETYRSYTEKYYNYFSDNDANTIKQAEKEAIKKLKSKYGDKYNISLTVENIENTINSGNNKKFVEKICPMYKINVSDVEAYYNLDLTAKVEGGWPWESKEDKVPLVIILKVKGQYYITQDLIPTIYYSVVDKDDKDWKY